MKDDVSRNTDLLERDDRLDISIDFAKITELPGASADEDLLSNWNSPDEGDTANPSRFANPSSIFDQILENQSQQCSSVDAATFVPERELVGSLFSNSIRSNVSFGPPVDRLRLPGLGDQFMGFRLLHVLGTGSFAKVYLARQGSLANRPVVLKISAIEGTEPQTLAQMQHTNVVPIYSVHEDTEKGLRGVCMPYFGGAALSKVLHEIWTAKQLPASGQTLLDALVKVSGPPPVPPVPSATGSDQAAPVSDVAQTARNKVARMSFVQAAVWITQCLAEGLQHSHERNVIHRDIKPSNILLSADVVALLLDFNVSQLADCHPDDASLGGTLSYMAPEHLRAAILRDKSSIAAVNHRSDVYSLGLVLYEMLVGVSPFERATNATIGPHHLQAILDERVAAELSLKKNSKLNIPWSLESIVRKSLAVDPLDRYASAAQFAEDLNRFLQDLPLKYAPELSRWEQVQKWVRRHPKLKTTALVTLAAALIIVPGSFVLSATRGHLAQSVEQVRAATALEMANQLEADTRIALSMSNTITANEGTIPQGIAKCQKTLGLFDVITNPHWQDQGYWPYLSGEKRKALSENVRELLLVLSAAQVRVASESSAKPELNDVAGRALSLLEIAERIRGLSPSQALWLDRARYLSLQKKDALAYEASKVVERTHADTAYDLYMVGAAHARKRTPAGQKEAISLLTRSIEMDKSRYWPHFERALCYLELGENMLAASDLGTCIGLWPGSSWAHFNLGYVFDQEGRKSEAAAEFTKAIQFAPEFRSAYFNRGLARLELREYAPALEDFDKVVKLGRRAPEVIAGRAMALEGLGKEVEADREFKNAMQGAKLIPGAPIERISWTYAFAVAHRDPKTAGRIFEEILSANPTHPQAHYGLGMLYMEEGDLTKAIRSFDEAINFAPNFMPPLRFRGIALARLGNHDEAAIEADLFVQKEPRNPETLYAAACVAALNARRLTAPKLIDYALVKLELALTYLDPKDQPAFRERMADDEDLSALQNDPLFLKLTGIKQKPQKSKGADSL